MADRVVGFEEFERRSAQIEDLEPPHSLDAERSLLGASLLNPKAFELAAEILDWTDFYRFAHQLLFRAMAKLHGQGIAIDLVTLKNILSAKELDDIGGPVYIAGLLDGMPHSANVEHYARIIKEKTARRRTILVANKLRIAAYDQQQDLPAILATSTTDIAKIPLDVGSEGVTLPTEALSDAIDVALEGRLIAAQGIPYCVGEMVPLYGMLGMLIAFAKVGKTTFGQALAAAVAMGLMFLGKATTQARVLIIAAEDPPEYVAFLAQHLNVTPGTVTFFRRSLILNREGLAQIVGTVQQGSYGLVLISSWQAVVRGLIRDENDNAGAVKVIEDVKAAARTTGVPWLIDAHSGKGEDQTDDADPSRAMRGASAAAGAADYTLSLRYANGPFGTQRKLSGKGRFVSFAPVTMDFDAATSTYTVVSTTKDAASETTWRLIEEMGALTSTPQTTAEIARAAGLVGDGKVTNTHRRQVAAALKGRPDVAIEQALRFGEKTTLYKRLGAMPK